ncbi:MAG: ABC transporter ATP-binding protein [Bacteroidetes bacterium]|nr:ABC transporter ATP-binding protein [Bacteroidota bacterium]
MSDIVTVSGLTKLYYRGSIEIPVLQNLNLSVPSGEFLALMGPSGSGKTTLLNLISGIDRPTSGSIMVGGTDIATLSESQLAVWRSRNVGFIFQFYNLIPVLTAYENVELPLELTSLSKKQKKERVEAMLNLVGLGDRMDHYPKQLSGGQQQRVAIARAIVTDPAILIGDEPTGDLDRKSAGDILTLLERLNKELQKTIIMVTHDPHAAERAHTIRHLEKGELMAS